MNRLPMIRFCLALSAFLLLAGHGTAAFAARTVPATFTAQIKPAPARPGETVTLTVTATIKAPWHVYSMAKVPPPGPVETTLSVAAGSLRPVGKVVESTPKRSHDPNFGKEVGYHEGTATFTQRLAVPKNAAANPKLPIVVTVRYMACNETMCLPPREVEVNTTLAIAAGAARKEFTGAGALAPAEGAPPIPPPANSAQDSGAGGLVPFLLAAFGAGLLALVTPCVFPMIPVTLAFFTKQATAKNGDGAASQAAVVRLAATYSLGIVLAFTALGAVLAATVGAAGPNKVAANPWVNLAFAALFVVFGLALLEVVELRPPAALQRLTGRRSGGTAGVLLMGLTFVIAAFTCTAPFIGTVLVAAAGATTGAQWFRPILGMAVFALALALPFFLLALFPGWLARLPRSGAWLSTVKGAMGFIELAAALKFLSNVDLVWQWKLLPAPVLLALWAMIAFAAAQWLLGILRVGFGTPEGRPTRARVAWAGAFGALCLYFLWGLTGRPVNRWVMALLPPKGYGYGAAHIASAGEDLFWHETLEAGLARAKTENKLVFIDFTGYACTNCRLMENDVFPNPGVRAELEKFVRVRLYTDGTDAASKRNQAYQEKTFGDVALPLYAVLTAEGRPVTQVAGINPVGKFTGFLRSAQERATQIAVAKE